MDRRGRGRPSLPLDRIKGERVCIYCTSAEKENFVEHARAAGMSEIELGRKALGKLLKKPPVEQPQKKVENGVGIADTSLYVPKEK